VDFFIVFRQSSGAHAYFFLKPGFFLLISLNKEKVLDVGTSPNYSRIVLIRVLVKF
jgi:hypothetical protein